MNEEEELECYLAAVRAVRLPDGHDVIVVVLLPTDDEGVRYPKVSGTCDGQTVDRMFKRLAEADSVAATPQTSH